jgi:hypothetical protein
MVWSAASSSFWRKSDTASFAGSAAINAMAAFNAIALISCSWFIKSPFALIIGGLRGFLNRYFLSSGFFRGRPILTARIISNVSDGYTACLVIGLIPALCIRASTVLKGRFSASHISSMVNPCTFLLSANITENFIKCKNIHAITLQILSYFIEKMKNSVGICLYLIDKVKEISYIYN